MSEEREIENRRQKAENGKKYPKIVAGVFIFNESDELLLIMAPGWQNKYTCAGGRVEVGEKLIDAAKREAKEETNLDVYDIKLIDIVDGLGLEESYKREDNHLIFVDYEARAKNINSLRLNKEGIKYKWLKPKEWLKRQDVEKYTKEIIERHLLEQESFEDKYKRALADYQNLAKQTMQEKIEFVKFANEQFLHEILPVYDNLKLALKHANQTPNNANIKEGVKHVVKQFKGVLKDVGVEEIKTVGEKFDPRLMEAIDGKGDKVKKEVRPGYKLNGKVIIPAKVVVG